MNSNEMLDRYQGRIEEFLKAAYNDGYKEGTKIKRRRLKNLRSDCHRESGDYDKDYADNWKDYTRFYGWCSCCKRPHSGRWAHIWDYCPWCGAKIDHKSEDPYPGGMTNRSKLMEKLESMFADVNPIEIQSHDNLEAWCFAWQNAMQKLISDLNSTEEG